MSLYQSTKVIDLGSCAFRQPKAQSHCRWLHGYRLQSKLWFGCNELDSNNWVVDFGSLKGLKKKFEDQFDHTTCIAKDDPALNYFTDLQNEDICDLRVMDGVGIEKFAEWCFNVGNSYIKKMTGGRCWIDKVEVWEHEKNSATYCNNHRETQQITYQSESERDVRLDHGEPLAAENADKDVAISEKNTDTNNKVVTNKWLNDDLNNPFGF